MRRDLSGETFDHTDLGGERQWHVGYLAVQLFVTTFHLHFLNWYFSEGLGRFLNIGRYRSHPRPWGVRLEPGHVYPQVTLRHSLWL